MRAWFILLAGMIGLLPGLTAGASVPTSVEWVDGESGRMNGRPFRLHDVDAPAANGVGAGVRAAACERESELGFEARAFMAELTRGKPVVMTASYGTDARGRQILDLSVDGEDIATAGLEAGMLKVWREDMRGETGARPDWCG